MKIFYSKSKNGFFSPDVHGLGLPFDSVEISTDAHQALLSGQTADIQITSNASGYPVLAARPPVDGVTLAAVAHIKRNRLISDTDYMLLADYPIGAERLGVVKAYRQALRDITAQPRFPFAIDWPIF